MVARNSGSEENGGAPRARAQKRGLSKASFDKKTIALVYDFDGTLSPRPMQDYAFLPQIGQDARAFWKESNRLAKEQGVPGTAAGSCRWALVQFVKAAQESTK